MTASYPSVTTIIGAPNPVTETREEWDRKRDRGTLVHDVVARMLKGEHISDEEFSGYEEITRNYLMAAVRFWQEQVIMDACLSWDDFTLDSKHIEVVVLHHQFQYAGRLDVITPCPGLFAGGQSLLDWKTGREREEEELMQLAAYAAAYLTQDRRRHLTGAASIHLIGDGTYKVTKRHVASLFARHYFTEFVHRRNEYFGYDEEVREQWNSQHPVPQL
jgi:hypothetical protein